MLAREYFARSRTPACSEYLSQDFILLFLRSIFQTFLKVKIDTYLQDLQDLFTGFTGLIYRTFLWPAHPHFNQKRTARLSHRHRSWYGFDQASTLSLCFLLLSHHLPFLCGRFDSFLSLSLSFLRVPALACLLSKSDRKCLRTISHRLPRQKGTSAWPLAWSSWRVYQRRSVPCSCFARITRT